MPASRSWRFGAVDYMAAVQRALGTVALSGRTATSPWDVNLAPSMTEAGVAVYEEQVLDQLLDDLAGYADAPSARW